jgi:nucleoside-diphosphate-sugar epimerase
VSLRIVLVDRTAPLVCPFCHDVLDQSGPPLVACARCGTKYHAECAKLHGKCVLLGCTGGFARTFESASERLALIVRGLGREPSPDEVSAIDAILVLGRYEAALRLRSRHPLVLGYFERSELETRVAALERLGLACFAVEAAELARVQLFLVRNIEREGSILSLRSPTGALRVIDLERPRLVVPGQYWIEESTPQSQRRRTTFDELLQKNGARRDLPPVRDPFVHVYLPGDPVALCLAYDALKDYSFLGAEKNASGAVNFRTIVALLEKGATVDRSLEGSSVLARGRVDMASRLLFRASGLASAPRTDPERESVPAVIVRAMAARALVKGDTIAIVGLGRVGSRIGRLLRTRGVRVRGTKRFVVSDANDAADELVLLDLESAEPLGRVLDGARALVYAAAPGESLESYELVYGTGLRAVLEAARRVNVERVLVLGSVAVFGEDGGKVVTEETPPQPRTAKGQVLEEAEKVVRGAGGVVLRLAGLYARGRGPQTLLERAHRSPNGRPELSGSSKKLLNLIHEEDAARAAVLCLDAWKRARASGVVHASDGTPVARSRFYAAIARAQRLLEPSFTPTPDEEDELARGFGRGKRVSNERLLGLAKGTAFPRFPRFEAALEAGELP